jgi:polyphosphate kinase
VPARTPPSIRVTRNADIDPDGEGVEEEEDYRLHMKKVLKKRMRLQPIRLEVEGTLSKNHEKLIRKELGLTPERVFHVRSSLDQGYIFALEDMIPKSERAQLLYSPFEPQLSPMVKKGVPMREQIEDHDVLLFYPYESMDPLLDLLREASTDDSCITIKITLYRVAKHSRLCESLIAAAENGKDVTVLMELRARFDEANNIAWAERLEDAGCTVIYGQEGYKVHSKICQITYHDGGKFTRITCLGTGNFNEKTARLYSDFMLMTAHPGIGEDGNAFFRNLSLGNLAGRYKYLRVAPIGLKPQIMGGLDREIARARAGEPAQAFLKMNSLTDRDVIDKISEACEAGVRVILIVRGICCIKANVPGKTDGLIVHQIVGRFLEHARVYAFGAKIDTVYLSSADMMTRNTERRVEIAYPVKDPVCRQLVIKYMNLQLADNVKARRLTAEGTWVRFPMPEGGPLVDSQETLIRLAYDRAQAAVRGSSSPLATVEQVMGQITPILHMAPEEAAAARKATEQAKPSDFAKRPQPTPEPPVAAAQAPDLVAGPAPSTAGARPPEPEPEPEKAPEPEPEPEKAETPMPESPASEGPRADKVAGGHSEPPRRGRIATAFALIGAGFRTLFAGAPDSRGDVR